MGCLGVHTGCLDIAIIINGGGGCVVAELLSIHIVVLALTRCQILVVLHVAIGVELKK